MTIGQLSALIYLIGLSVTAGFMLLGVVASGGMDKCLDDMVKREWMLGFLDRRWLANYVGAISVAICVLWFLVWIFLLCRLFEAIFVGESESHNERPRK